MRGGEGGRLRPHFGRNAEGSSAHSGSDDADAPAREEDGLAGAGSLFRTGVPALRLLSR